MRVPASAGNLQPLWKYISEQKEWFNYEDAVGIILMHQSHGKTNPRLEVHINGPIEAHSTKRIRAYIDSKLFEWSIDGLTEALAYAKSTADRVRRKDFCSRCRVDGFTNTGQGVVHPRKRLKARPLPYCAECMLDLATGGPAQKKARHK